MSKLFGRLALGALVLGTLLYAIWAYYTTMEILAIIVAVGLVATTVITRLTRKQWNHSLLITAITSVLVAIFMVATGRKSMGAIGAALIMLAVLIFVFYETTKPPKKSSS